jgi:hypothetical protein
VRQLALPRQSFGRFFEFSGGSKFFGEPEHSIFRDARGAPFRDAVLDQQNRGVLHAHIVAIGIFSRERAIFARLAFAQALPIALDFVFDFDFHCPQFPFFGF